MSRKLKTWPKVVLLLLVVGGGYYLLRHFGRQYFYAPAAVITATPDEINLPYDSVGMATSDGFAIRGWFVPAPPEDSPPAAKAAPPVLLFFHGGKGNMSNQLDKLRLFHEMGLDVFIIDYRGYGQSRGTPTERGLYDDALTAYFHLTETRGVPADRIFIFGEGLGAAVAIELASKVRSAGLITEAATASVAEKIEDDWPLIPWRKLLGDEFDAIAIIRDVNVPILMIHSVDDEVIPVTDSQRLFSVAREPKQFIEIKGPHEEAFMKSFDLYFDKIADFVEEHCPQPRAAATTPTETTDE